jgi:hypothetical protein
MFNGSTGNPVTAADGIRAALYWAPAGSTNFVQIGAVVNVGVVLPGIFAGGTCTTGPDTTGGTMGQFQVRAWGGGYATYEQAAVYNGLIGESGILQVKTGNPAGAPPTPPGSLVANGLATNYVNINVAGESTPPTLQILRTNGTVQLLWPASAGNFQLQSADNPAAGWSADNSLVQTNGANAAATVLSTSQQKYYRLLGQ